MLETDIKNTNHSDEINLKKFYELIAENFFIISGITTAFAILSVIIALSLPNIYSSKILMAPTNSEDSLTSQLSRYSDLAGLAGFNIPNEGASKSKEGIERIKSFDFFSNHFLPYIKLENMIAVEKWSAPDNTFTYDKRIFDKNNNQWVREVKYPRSKIPSAQEAYIHYKKFLSVRENDNLFVTISIDHKSPQIAKKWVDIIFKQINKSMRNEAKKSADNSVEFLNKSIQTTNIQSIKEALTKLLEDQMRILMLVSSNEEYVFKIIDSSVIPEKKSSPNRVLICIIGTLIGIILSIIFVFIRKIKNQIF